MIKNIDSSDEEEIKDNFGSRVEENFACHDKMFPNVPKMCSEMWNGWFDAWGDEKHHTTSADDYARQVVFTDILYHNGHRRLYN